MYKYKDTVYFYNGGEIKKSYFSEYWDGDSCYINGSEMVDISCIFSSISEINLKKVSDIENRIESIKKRRIEIEEEFNNLHLLEDEIKEIQKRRQK